MGTQLQLFFAAAQAFCNSSQRTVAMAKDRRDLSKVLSNDGLDIRQDVDAARQASDFVRLDDHNKKMAALENDLRASMCRSFIAGAIFGVFILVAIILGVVSILRIDNTASDIHNIKQDYTKTTDLNEALEKKLSTSEFDTKFSLSALALISKVSTLE